MADEQSHDVLSDQRRSLGSLDGEKDTISCCTLTGRRYTGCERLQSRCRRYQGSCKSKEASAHDHEGEPPTTDHRDTTYW
jgi:hypothetical protein